MSGALIAARDMSNMFADAGEQLQAHVQQHGDEGAAASILEDIDQTGQLILDMLKGSTDIEADIALVLKAGVELGERVVFRLSTLLHDRDEDSEDVRQAHLSAVIALTIVTTYLSEGEVRHDLAI